MRIQQARWSQQAGWEDLHPPLDGPAHLVLAFGGHAAMADAARMADLAARHPGALYVGCSTAGEIQDTRVSDETLVTTAIRFEHTKARREAIRLRSGEDSAAAGARLAQAFPSEGLAHILVFSDGLHVNGTRLVAGMAEALPPGVQVTGGLAGDGGAFAQTLTLADGRAETDQIVAVGLYGDRLEVGYGSLGGWDSFGPQRRVTRSEANVLYELDGRPALALYRQYLGDRAAGLPATGLLFPLSVAVPGRDGEVVRTILAIDEDKQSLTFAGDIPEGSMARLMKANFDRLVDGAEGAARTSRSPLKGGAELAILISCVGRKLVLKQRVEEEVEAVREVLGPRPALTGFYSYGEICPAAPDAACDLHNQTMTITTLRES